jgi:metallo-beta-lactamase class B
MRKYIIKTSLCFLTLFLPYAIIHSQDSILFIVNESVEVVQLTSDIYQHTSYVEMEMWGRVGANGLIIKSASGALMVDTPWNNAQTKTLIEWIRNEWKMEVLKVIVTHSHTDCAGGLKACQEAGIESYGLALTDEYLKQKKQPSLTYTF